MQPVIAVVIPYFQRRPGVLRKALGSIAAQQQRPAPVQVLVIDDASPVPAADEITGLALPEGVSVQVILQPNSGPGAARNTGLAALPPGTRHVAFLDSDDEWTPLHLARAWHALEQGHDFFFGDHYQLNQSVGAFGRGGRITPAAHPVIDGPFDGLHAYQGDLFDQVLRGNVVGTSTVVFRRERFPEARFLVEFTTAGEDYLFWMTLARQDARTAFSEQIEAVYGRGVNVYSGSGWGTEGFMLRVHQEMCYRQAVRRLFPLDAAQAGHVQREIVRLRGDFVRDLLRRLRSRSGWPAGLLRRQATADPMTFVAAPGIVLRALLSR